MCADPKIDVLDARQCGEAVGDFMDAGHPDPDHCRRSRDSPAPGSTASSSSVVPGTGEVAPVARASPQRISPVRSMPGWWRAGSIPTGHLGGFVESLQNPYRRHTDGDKAGSEIQIAGNPSGLSKQAHTGHHHSTGSGEDSMSTVTAVLDVHGLHWATRRRWSNPPPLRRPGVSAVEANALNQTATVVFDPAATSVEQLSNWVRDCDFTSGPLVPDHTCDPMSEPPGAPAEHPAEHLGAEQHVGTPTARGRSAARTR